MEEKLKQGMSLYAKLEIFRESQKLFPKWHSHFGNRAQQFCLNPLPPSPSECSGPVPNLLAFSHKHYSPLFLSMILSVLVKYADLHTNCWVHWRTFQIQFLPFPLQRNYLGAEMGFLLKSNTY